MSGLCLLALLPPPARAQSGNWAVTDQSGNPIAQNSGDGSYSLTGTITGSASNTYPEGLAQAAQSDPAYKGYWLSAYAPNVLTGGFLYRASPSNTATGAAVSVSGLAANAANDPNNWAHCGDDYDNGTFYVGNFNDWDFLDSPTEVSDYPAINGSINASVAGTLMAFWTWNGTGSPPPYIDLLLTTTLSATTYVTYNSGGYASGLSASASATDEVNGQGFNETATASAGDGATAGVPSVVGRHLVRAQVDPATGIAEVYVNGSAAIKAGNTVPAGVMYPYFPYVYYYPYYGPASAQSIASLTATARPFSADLQGHSTVDNDPAHGYTTNPPWDGGHPRFFSGTGCRALATVVPLSGYVSHAQLLIGGTLVREYWDNSASGKPATLPAYAFSNTNQPSVPLNVMFDSTHFGDQTPISIQMKVWDTAGDYYDGQISGPAYNKAEALGNHTTGFADYSPDLPGVVASSLTPNYSTAQSMSMGKGDILSSLPNLTAFYISTHGYTNPGQFGDCSALYNSSNSFYLYAVDDPTNGGMDITTEVGTKNICLPPYNFVFIDGCDTGRDNTLATAFRVTGTDQAFLGWAYEYFIDEEHHDWVVRLMQNLELETPLRDAVITADMDGTADSPGLYLNEPPGATDQGSAGPPAIPVIYGDGATTTHGVYGSPFGYGGLAPLYDWFRPL